MIINAYVFVCMPENGQNISGISRNYLTRRVGREGNEFFAIDMFCFEQKKQRECLVNEKSRSKGTETKYMQGTELVSLILEQGTCWGIVGYKIDRERNILGGS